MILRENDVFGDKYRILRRLGKGGMGVVYRAMEIAIERQVAIKFILDLKLVEGDTELALARMVREAHMLSRVDHPGIVKLYDFGQDGDGVPYMVTEFIAGRNLSYPDGAVQLADGPRWAGWDPFLDDIDGTLDILESVHAAELVHRDLKPQNLLIQRSHGQKSLVHLLDFGLARLLHSEDSRDLKWMERLNSDAIKGTPDYMAPEQFHHRSPESRLSDLYSVGVLLHRGLYGTFPYPEFREFVDKDEYIRMRKLPAEERSRTPIPDPVARVVDRAIAFDPANRFPDARTLRRELRRARNSSRPEKIATITLRRRSSTGALPLPPEPGSHRDRPAPIPSGGCPYLDDCLVVVSPTAGGQQASERPGTSVPGIIGKVLMAQELRAPGVGPVLRLKVIESSAFFDPDPAQASEALDRLMFSRVVLWEKTGMDRPASRLLTLQVASGNVSATQLAGQDPPPALRHLPAVEIDPDAKGKDFIRVREGLLGVIMAALGRRWWRRALTLHWARLERDDRVRELRDESLLAWADGRKRRALGAAETLGGIAPRDPFFRFHRAYLRSKVVSGDKAWRKNARDLQKVVTSLPWYGPAWRELGVAWNRLDRRQRALHYLREAIRHDPRDYDALASYGGVLRRQAALLERATEEAYAEALKTYEDAREISHGHPYPLLNWLRLDCRRRKVMAVDTVTKGQLDDLVKERAAQAEAGIDRPWCYMDQVEALLYLERPEDAEAVLVECLGSPREDLPKEALETFRDTVTSVATWHPDPRVLAPIVDRIADELATR